MTPRISVVLPVYNGAEELPRTMESLLGQTEGDFELIAVDDGSADATAAILREYAARDGRIRVMAQGNAGLTRALIAGCEVARAPLIARQDCGDMSHPERFRRMAGILEQSPSAVVAGCEVDFTGPGGELLYATSHGGKDLRQALLQTGIEAIVSLPHHGAAVMRADAFRRAGGYRAQFYFAQDLDLWIRMAALGELLIEPRVLYEARLLVRSISSLHRAEQFACAKIAIAVRDAPDDARREELLRQAARIRPRRGSITARGEATALYFVASCLRRRDDPRWRGYASRAVRRSPLHVPSWLLLLRG
jgi:glycosyltransferase involved in cell wall biosynthesis